MTVRSRFAPSPTGSMHIGNLRTALFSWLYARHCKGTAILRIEDTDLERSTPEAIKIILDSLEWLDLKFDEGPFYQTLRFERYKEVILTLLREGKAYRCYCSKERLDKLREDQLLNKDKPRYDEHCWDITDPKDPKTPYVIRFRNPKEGSVVFEDRVRGRIEIQNNELDDLIIARSDGSPTYNFTVVIDDIDMKITHVIRGADHINNTPRQINIFKALNAEPPIYAHVPMILGEDGKKLSKRHGAVSVMDYRKEGILPHALLNYLVRLGWSHGDQEIFSIDEMIEHFDLDTLSKSPASLNPEKLLWINQHYLKTDDKEIVAKELQWHFDEMKIDCSNGPVLSSIVEAQAERCKTLKEMAEKSRFFYERPTEYDEKAVAKNFTPETKHILSALIKAFSEQTPWVKEELHDIVIHTAENFKVKLGEVAQPIRIAMTGNSISPPIDITLELMGREETLTRLQRAITFLFG